MMKKLVYIILSLIALSLSIAVYADDNLDEDLNRSLDRGEYDLAIQLAIKKVG